MTGPALDRVRVKLEARGSKIVGQPNGIKAQCPAHDDTDPSLSIRQLEPGRIRIKCFVGCPDTDVLDALGLTVADLWDEPKGKTYTYDGGRVVNRPPDKKKTWQAGNRDTKDLYRLSEVRAAVAEGRTVWLVEGEPDVEALRTMGETATTAPNGGGSFAGADVEPLRGAHVIAVVDQDPTGAKWLEQVRAQITGLVADLTVKAPAEGCNDLTDHVMAGHGLEDLAGGISRAPSITLAAAEAIFHRWLGAGFDVDTLRVCLAAEAVRRLDGDPLWVMVVSGSGNAKTETVAAFEGAGAKVRSALTGESALLSATQQKDKAKDATGGLLREIGATGTVVLKDFTSILSMNRDRRAEVLGALREVYDGSWTRTVGSDGGKVLEWSGRVALIAACTTAWDSAHSVIATMGDRFAVIRADSRTGRTAGGRQALGNVGSETIMRAELQAAVGGVIAGMVPPGALTEIENEALLAAAELVTWARSAVETDFKGAVEWAHAPEMPTRFAKQLAQVVRGGIACGMDRRTAVALALRVAADSVPPLRLAVMRALAAEPMLTTRGVAAAIQKPWATTDRTLQALHAHELVAIDTEDVEDGKGWRYELAACVDLTALDVTVCNEPVTQAIPEMSIPTYREEGPSLETRTLDISGALKVGGESDIGAVCPACCEPMDPWLTANNYTAHLGCEVAA